MKTVDLKRLETPLGTMIACGTSEGICLLEFTDRVMLDTELKDLERKLQAVIVEGYNLHFEKLEAQLAEYFEGKLQEFDIQLFTPGTVFQNTVWQSLRSIPYGQTRTYKQQAIVLGSVSAVRAVANANGMNRIAVIIPCHRVVGSNGNLTGYAAGLWRKKYLLDLEAVNSGFRMF